MLRPRNIRPGAVAYLDERALLDDPEVTLYHDDFMPYSAAKGFRPMVCVAGESGRSWWLPFTSNRGRGRLRIKPEWVAVGWGKLAAGRAFLQSGAKWFEGPDPAFLQASSAETDLPDRACLNVDGIRAVRAAMKREACRARAVEVVT